MVERLVYFRFEPQRFFRSGRVMGLSAAGVGIYVELLAAQWDSAGDGLPAQERALRGLTRGEPEEWAETWPHLKTAFPQGKDGRRRNPWLAAQWQAATEAYEAMCAQRREAARRSVEARRRGALKPPQERAAERPADEPLNEPLNEPSPGRSKQLDPWKWLEVLASERPGIENPGAWVARIKGLYGHPEEAGIGWYRPPGSPPPEDPEARREREIAQQNAEERRELERQLEDAPADEERRNLIAGYLDPRSQDRTD